VKDEKLGELICQTFVANRGKNTRYRHISPSR